MIFLDTHVIVWRALDPRRIPSKTRDMLAREEKKGMLRICEISLYEIAMLIQRKRLNAGVSYADFMGLVLAANRYQLVGINADIAGAAAGFPVTVNKDPADRIILATTLYHGARLVTADQNLRECGVVPAVW